MAEKGDLDAFKGNASTEEEIDVTKKIRVGIIGTGWIAEAHVLEYKKMPDVEIVAAADLIPGKAEAFMEKMGVSGVRFYPNDQALIDAEKDTIDAVSICTYNRQHARSLRAEERRECHA